MLGPVSSHAAAETRQVVASLGNQPTVAGHSGDHPPDLETLRATPRVRIRSSFRAICVRERAQPARNAMNGRSLAADTEVAVLLARRPSRTRWPRWQMEEEK